MAPLCPPRMGGSALTGRDRIRAPTSAANPAASFQRDPRAPKPPPLWRAPRIDWPARGHDPLSPPRAGADV